MVIGGTGVRLVRAVSERGASLADAVRVADTFGRRLLGVLARGLGEGEGVLLVPCEAVHTFFLRSPLDVLFLARDGTVLAAREGLGPWRVAWTKGAWAALELPPGSLRRAGLEPGERVFFRAVAPPAPGEAPAKDGSPE